VDRGSDSACRRGRRDRSRPAASFRAVVQVGVGECAVAQARGLEAAAVARILRDRLPAEVGLGLSIPTPRLW